MTGLQLFGVSSMIMSVPVLGQVAAQPPPVSHPFLQLLMQGSSQVILAVIVVVSFLIGNKLFKLLEVLHKEQADMVRSSTASQTALTSELGEFRKVIEKCHDRSKE